MKPRLSADPSNLGDCAARRRNGRLAAAIVLLLAALGGIGIYVSARALNPARPGLPLTSDQRTMVVQAVDLMRRKGLDGQADLADSLLSRGIWRAAGPTDAYLKQSEASGDTPYAYTLSSGHTPSAIVLGPRFFNTINNTTAGCAAVMIHEMGHYQAYVKTGKSTEYDGYKAEYDTHNRIGLSPADGLVYFSMLDGVAEYVVPRDQSYRAKPDIADYLKSGTGT